jgi:hypothetical protein
VVVKEVKRLVMVVWNVALAFLDTVDRAEEAVVMLLVMGDSPVKLMVS